MSGIFPQALTRARPLILLNDKRFTDKDGTLQDDRRMLLDIEALSRQLAAAFPHADVLPVRLRDLGMPDQLRLMAATRVFVTTSGSSSQPLVFMPRGATAIVVGQPEDEKTKALGPGVRFQSFEELDRW